MVIYKGNEFAVKVSIKINNSYIDISDVEKIEFSFNDTFTKFYPSSDVSYSNNYFYITLKQEETFNLDYTFDIQARIKFISGEIFASNIESLDLNQTLQENII